MAFNIVDLVKGQINDQLLGQLGGAIGADRNTTSTALSGALPGLLSGLAGVANRPGGAGGLIDALRSQDDGMLANVGSMLANGNGSQLADQGSSMLTSILGSGALGKLASALAGFAGLDGNRGSSILGMLAPIVIGALKNKVMGDGMDAGGLAGMLSSQQANINAAMPQGFNEQLRSQGFFDSIASGSADTATPTASYSPEPARPAPQTTQTTQTTQAAPQSSSGGVPKWLLPLAAVAVLGFLAFKFLMPGDDAVDSASGAMSSAADASAALTKGVSTEALAAAQAALPEGVDMPALTGQLQDIFGNTTSALSSVKDAASAQAVAPALQDATASLGKFSGLFKRLPEAAKGPLSTIISNGIGSLQPIVDQVLTLPGVGPVLEPILTPMLTSLQGMAG